MTNTLTWDIRFPIQLPKLNTNVLSVISFFVLSLMLFTAAAAIVEAVCESEADALSLAEIAYAVTGVALIGAEGLLVIAIASMNPMAIAGALIGLGVAVAAHAATGALLQRAAEDYWDCMNRHTASGGCDSGSCNG